MVMVTLLRLGEVSRGSPTWLGRKEKRDLELYKKELLLTAFCLFASLFLRQGFSL